MAFVLDASVAVGWVVATQASAYGKRLRLRAKREPYHAPVLWRLEVVNAVRVLEKRRRMTPDAAEIAVNILDRMQPIFHNAPIPLAESLRLARRYDLSAYDASYLALALELHLPIACTDGALRSALGRAGVKLA